MMGEGIFSGFLIGAARHLYRLFREPEYRRYCWLVTRYGMISRYRQRTVYVHGWKLIVPDVASFLSAYKEIFVEEIYAFRADSEYPIILDCGANIGLSVLYFKKKYPTSKVIAYEADPKIFNILKNNIYNNGITGVEIINMAIWSSGTIVDFSVEGADGGRINTESDKNIIKVPAVSLFSILKETQFDFVKVDIEGAEFEALKGCDELLNNLKYVFIEFHSFVNKKQELGSLIFLFERKGFRVHVHPPFTAKKPFLGIQGVNGMDMQLNLFFWKHDNEQA